MNKRFLSLMAAGAITVSLIAPSAVNAAGVTMEDATTVAEQKTGDKSGIFDTGTPDASNPNGNTDQNTAGPKITVKKDKFLVMKGEPFDFATELGLKIVDETDGDITSQLKIPSIDTSKAGTLKKTVKAVNTKGEVSTLDLIINIVDVADSVDLADKSELDSYDLSKLVTGDTTGLTLAVKSVAEDGKSFVLTITDGTNALEKTVTLTGAEGSDKAEGEEQEKEDATEGEEQQGEDTTQGEQQGDATQGETNTGNDGNATLPQTGAVATGVGGVGALTTLAGFMKFRKRR